MPAANDEDQPATARAFRFLRQPSNGAAKPLDKWLRSL
jgi:hypothetical protein